MVPRHRGQASGGSAAPTLLAMARRCCHMPCRRKVTQQSVQKRWPSTEVPSASRCGGTSVCSFSSMQTTQVCALAAMSLLPRFLLHPAPGAGRGTSTSSASSSDPSSSTTRSPSMTGLKSVGEQSSATGSGHSFAILSLHAFASGVSSSSTSMTRSSPSFRPSLPNRMNWAAIRAPSNSSPSAGFLLALRWLCWPEGREEPRPVICPRRWGREPGEGVAGLDLSQKWP
mmetsp:Transcript_45703/g.118224  ORF Transcript_45703/g.118224 Transcript_45703/m.118224 type:complete len:228 (+) Transcript_45703:159-842(+)